MKRRELEETETVRYSLALLSARVFRLVDISLRLKRQTTLASTFPLAVLGRHAKRNSVRQTIHKKDHCHFLYTVCKVSALSALTVFMSCTCKNPQFKYNFQVKLELNDTAYDLHASAPIFKLPSKKLWALLTKFLLIFQHWKWNTIWKWKPHLPH